MAKETCSIRLDGELKSDLDKLLKYNGQSLGHLVSVQMSHFLLELIDDFEHQMRDNRRQYKCAQTVLTFLESAEPTKNPKLFPDKSKDPKLTWGFIEKLDKRSDLDKALRILRFEWEFPLTKEDLIQIQNQMEQDFRELDSFFRVADSFKSIIQDGCIDWVDGSNLLKKNIRDRLIKNYDRNDSWEERLDKIQNRYWFPYCRDMWNGKKPVTARFLNKIYWSFS